MNEGAAGANGGAPPAAARLIGIGPEHEFTIARQLVDTPVMWLYNIASLADLCDRPLPTDPFILLLDGDLPSGELIGVLDQFAALVSTRPMVLQITKPQIRLVVSIMQHGVVDVLPKPYSLARLTMALDEIVAQPEGRRRP